MHVFIDLDGVMADFVTSALRSHDAPHLADQWPPGEFNIAKVIGVSDTDFWQTCDGHDWWAGLEPYPWMHELIACVNNVWATWSVASSPSRSPSSSAGKVDWMNRHLGGYSPKGYFRAFMLGPHKHLLAGPGKVLIDDNDDNCMRFESSGGRAVLFPQPWNDNHRLASDRLGYVADRLAHFKPICTPQAAD